MFVTATPITPSLSALPSSFTSGQLVTLTCSSTTPRASATLTYMWLQNDGVLQGQTAPVLQITSFSNEHTGRYACKAVVASRVSSSSNMLELAPSGQVVRSLTCVCARVSMSGCSSSLSVCVCDCDVLGFVRKVYIY